MWKEASSLKSLTDSLELLKIKPQAPAATPSIPPASTARGSTASAKPKHITAHARLDDGDDDEEPPIKKIKGEIGAEAERPETSVKLQHTSDSSRAAAISEHKDVAPTTVNSTTQASTQSTIRNAKPDSASATTKSEEDDVEILEVRPVSGAQPDQAKTHPVVAATTSQPDDQAELNRKKTLLKMRLAEMKLERELFELGD